MLTVVANKSEAIVSDDRKRIYMNVTREEAKRITLGKVCVWKDREVLYRTRDYYIEIGFKLVDSMEKEKRIERMYNMFNLMQGDCSELMKDIPDGSVDLIVTDPPYLHVKGGMKNKNFKGTWKPDSNMVTNMSDFGEVEIFNFLNTSIPKMKKVNMYIFCSKLQLVSYFKYISMNKKLKYDLLVWDKVKYTMKSTKFYTSDIEYVVRIYQAGVSLRKVLIEDRTKSDIKHYMKRQAHLQPRGEHGTMKPVNLIENFIRVASDEYDVVLDPFMGSGTTGVACLNLNRNFIGMELDENYFNIAKERIENHEKGVK